MAIAFDAAIAFDSPDYTFDGVATSTTPVVNPPTPASVPGGGTYWRQPPDIRIERERRIRDDEDAMMVL